MRALPLLILVVIVGAVAYIFLFRKDVVQEIQKQGEKALQSVSGYDDAKTPRAAMDQFVKAIKARDYKAAALYTTTEYADKLKRAHTACRDLGSAIDSLNDYIDDKGFKNDKCTQLLFILDPFPKSIKVKGVQEVKGGQVGAFELEMPKITEGWQQNQLEGLGKKLYAYHNALGAPVLPLGASVPLEIKSEGEGDKKIWKIDVKLTQDMHDGIEFYMSNYKSYLEGIESVRMEVRQGRFLKDQLPQELMNALIKSK